MRQHATMNDVMNAFEHNAKMTNAHDLIMAVYETRKAKRKAWNERNQINGSERQRVYKEWFAKRPPEDRYACWEPPGSLELSTHASKEAHAAYTTASHRAGAAMRALMKYGREHGYETD